jgi:hypothetical protein
MYDGNGVCVVGRGFESNVDVWLSSEQSISVVIAGWLVPSFQITITAPSSTLRRIQGACGDGSSVEALGSTNPTITEHHKLGNLRGHDERPITPASMLVQLRMMVSSRTTNHRTLFAIVF